MQVADQFYSKNICADYFLAGRLTANNLANQQSTNNEYNHFTQSTLLINNVPLSAYTNNYLIKFIIPVNKTGQLPGPRIYLMCHKRVDCHINTNYPRQAKDLCALILMIELQLLYRTC